MNRTKNFSSPQRVLFTDGHTVACQIYVYSGACMVGDPTAYCYRNDQLVWVVRGPVCWEEVK